ncbi:MAG: S9 family peptidase [Bacteroidetes bacterium]|nr:MAG: S9 family peptidase [Bacteroidota bacterium]
MKRIMFILCLLGVFRPGWGQSEKMPAIQKLEPLDVFQLEYVSDPQISPDGQRIVYVRNFKDIMTDRNLSNLWMVNFDGTNNHPLTTGNQNDYAPRWSPDGKKLLYVSTKDGSSQIYLRWLDNGAEAKLTNLQESPGNITWSPDGRWIAMTAFVPESPKTSVRLPAKPEGAKWAEAPKYIDRMYYRRDGRGYVRPGYTQIFVLPAEGGTPRQLTFGENGGISGLAWSKNREALIFGANLNKDWEHDPNNSEIFKIPFSGGSPEPLTARQGPDHHPAVSPDGKLIAYLGYDDKYLGFQVSKIYLMNFDGSNVRCLTPDLDLSVSDLQWSHDGSGLYFQYSNHGNGKIGFVDLRGRLSELTGDVGGLSLGRPYSGGSFSVASNGNFAFTHSRPDHPADLAAGNRNGGQVVRLTDLNADLFGFKKLGTVEEIWFESSYDKRRIQGWICKPPDFDPNKKYPLILEIHGGPFANYGDRFSAEIQLYAAAGYVVLYANPRGSSSYGSEFGNLIHHNYPNQDYDDLMSGVDAVLAKGYIDEENLFVTGGSGGGVLTAWIVGHTDRFRAAVVAKPVINWYSFVLNADGPGFFYKYWFPGLPWEHLEHYMKRSPISYVGNVKTPTMLLTGERDYRTPISETEQFYGALQIQGVESAMVRIPESGHGIAGKPSYLLSKVVYILDWFERHKK